MKTLDDAVIELSGVLPANHHESHQLYTDGSKYILGLVCDSDRDIAELNKWLFVCDQKQFQSRAKELGFVGRYRWGVEYKTDGKRPELVDGISVAVQVNSQFGFTGKFPMYMREDWSNVVLFKVTDERYKPQDTSYLDKPDSSTHSAESSADNGVNWYDYDKKERIAGRMPPVGESVLVSLGQGVVVAYGVAASKHCIFVQGANWTETTTDFLPLDHDRKEKAQWKLLKDILRRNANASYDKTASEILAAGFKLVGGQE